MDRERKLLLDDLESLLNFIAREDNLDTRKILYSDLKNKLETFSKDANRKKTKEKVDVIIFTVTETEQESLKQEFNFRGVDLIEHRKINGRIVWKSELERTNRPKLSLLISQIGEAGTVKAAIACLRIFERYDCDLAILTGIAAGNDEGTSLYSVIITEGVADYEPQRLEKERIVYRPIPYPVKPVRLMNQMRNFTSSNQKQWKERLKERFEKISESKANDLAEYKSKNSKDFISTLEDVKMKLGIVGSGNKLIADNTTLTTLKEEIPYQKGIIAAEMEAAGFCPAAEEFEKKWIMIRGISDYGKEEDKNDQLNKKFQWVAALSAICAVLEYLENEYSGFEAEF